MTAARLLLAAACGLYPHTYGVCQTTAPSAATQYLSTIEVPAAEPPAGAQYAWVMAEASPTMFTQVGWVWFSAGTDLSVDGSPVPTDGPHLFAYTTAGQGDGDDLGAAGTFTLGPELTPGSAVTVDIARAGSWYEDEALESGLWTGLQQAVLSGAPTWLAASESWGPPTTVLFSARAYYADGWTSLPDEALPAPC